MKRVESRESSGDIAVIGMAGRFPGARSCAELWDNLCRGVESITFFSDEELTASGLSRELLIDPRYVRARGVLSDLESFDAAFFRFTPREAALLDPQHRLFLECCWEALEVAGHVPERCGGRIGVFGGASKSRYLQNHLRADEEAHAATEELQIAIGNERDYLTTLVSYKLNLRGPSFDVQTACSTSLVAVHLAIQSLLTHECDVALAGGVSVRLPQRAGYLHEAGGILSPDGHCRAFDAKARGTVVGGGAGVVTLRRMEDALAEGDRIHAVLKGSAINNDGCQKMGFTAPSVDGQADVIAEALAVAGIEPETVTYVEAHGTGTPLGDPVEIAALCQAFDTSRRSFCAIGSIKTNVGHLDAAAGVTGLIKTVLALEHEQLPPSLHFEQPNPEIDFADSPFFVNTRLVPWTAGTSPRRAGVSSFGIGGTNAHVLLEEAPPTAPASPSGQWQTLIWSARTESALAQASRDLAAHLGAHQDLPLADVAHTLQIGRTAFSSRCAMACRTSREAVEAIESRDQRRIFKGTGVEGHTAVAFMFPGQGAQHASMGRELYRTQPVFRAEIDRCSEILRTPLGADMGQMLYSENGARAGEAERVLMQTRFAQPFLFGVEYALARLWISWGVMPAAMIGHSVGEYVAACLADVFSLEDALALVADRGRMMQELPDGAMLAVLLPVTEVEPLLGEGLSVAADNGPAICTVSGPTGAVESLHDRLRRDGIACERIQTRHAFHSFMMDPVVEAYVARVKAVRSRPPTIPFVSNLTGRWISGEESRDPRYWAQHLRQRVRFREGLQRLLEERPCVLLEVGPGHALSTLAKRASGARATTVVVPSMRHPRDESADEAVLHAALARLWVAGVDIDWSGYRGAEVRKRVALPTYPFERRPHWIGASQRPFEDGTRAAEAAPESILAPEADAGYVAPGDDTEAAVASLWQALLGIEPIGIHDNFFELGGSSLVAIQLVARVRKMFRVEISLSSLFEAPTVSGLSQLIRLDGPTGEELEQVEQLLTEIEGISAEEARSQLSEGSRPEGGMAFSLFFFSDDGSKSSPDKYRLLLECAKFADRSGFSAVWTPERHFQDFGGLYPNPSVLGAALAMSTERIQIRAGSVVVPLHHPIRVAEEWAVVDNLSGGRAGVAFASGWHPHDFVLASGAIDERRDDTLRHIQTIRDLWAGKALRFPRKDGTEHYLRILPRPLQPELPTWLSISGNPKTWIRAGEIGASVLTTIINQPFDEIAAKIRSYKETLQKHGFDPGKKTITVMLHTFLGDDDEEVKATVRRPMTSYLKTFLRQHDDLLTGNPDFGASGVPEADKEALAELAFERYFESTALLGTPEKCSRLIERLLTLGVNEVACLVDFGLDTGTVLRSLQSLNVLRERYERR